MASKDSSEVSDGELLKEFTEGENGRYISFHFHIFIKKLDFHWSHADYSNSTATCQQGEFEGHFEGYGGQVSLSFVF